MQQKIQDWLTKKVSHLTKTPCQSIDINTPLSAYGLDSVQSVGFSGDIEEKFKISLEPTVLWDYPTIKLVSEYLIKEFNINVDE